MIYTTGAKSARQTSLFFTPGPWRIHTDGFNKWIEIEPNKIALIRAKDADLTLISAAPDLLAILSRILYAHDTGNNGAVTGEAVLCHQFAETARAAINKATGRD